MNHADHERAYKYDTLRFLLMFLVIVGHFMELFAGEWVSRLYKIIYSFHMPAFLFLTGKFAKFGRRKILKHFCIPYLIFQTLYLCFSAKVLTGTEIVLQYTTPYWILWYLLAVIFYYMLIPVLPDKGTVHAEIAIAAAFLLCLLAGFEASIGYYLSLSRFLVNLPFFLWGYYADSLPGKAGLRHGMSRLAAIVLSLVVILLGESYILKNNVPPALLYGASSYSACGSSMIERLVVMIAAAGWIIFLDSALPNRQIPVVSVLGQNIMPVFLLHAFVVKLALKYSLFHFTQTMNLLLACVLAITLIAVFGNQLFGRMFQKIF